MLQKKKTAEEILFHVKNKGQGDEEGVWMLEDGSIFAMLEITPIPLYDLKKSRQQEIIDKFNQNFFKKLDFPIEILIRPVNANIDKKIAILDSLLSYNINKTDNTKLIEYYESFIKWFKEYLSKNVKTQFVYYAIVNYNPYYQKSNFAEQYRNSLGMLKKRIDFVRESFASIGIKTKQLTTREIENIYDSFLRFHVYSEGKYLMPQDWINLHKKRQND